MPHTKVETRYRVHTLLIVRNSTSCCTGFELHHLGNLRWHTDITYFTEFYCKLYLTILHHAYFMHLKTPWLYNWASNRELTRTYKCMFLNLYRISQNLFNTGIYVIPRGMINKLYLKLISDEVKTSLIKITYFTSCPMRIVRIVATVRLEVTFRFSGKAHSIATVKVITKTEKIWGEIFQL